MKNENCIIYIGKTANRNDSERVITLGTCFEWRLPCREFEKQFDALHVLQLPSTKSKQAWDRWEDQHLSPWMDCLMPRTRVIHDLTHMKDLGVYPSCRGRTNNWWKLQSLDGFDIGLDEVIVHVQEKLNRG